jgi:hypothetical protein
MDRFPPARAATRTLAQHRDAHDLRAAIVDHPAASRRRVRALDVGGRDHVHHPPPAKTVR